MPFKVVISYASGPGDEYSWPTAFSAGAFYGRAVQGARFSKKDHIRKIAAFEGERVLAEWSR